MKHTASMRHLSHSLNRSAAANSPLVQNRCLLNNEGERRLRRLTARPIRPQSLVVQISNMQIAKRNLCLVFCNANLHALNCDQVEVDTARVHVVQSQR